MSIIHSYHTVEILMRQRQRELLAEARDIHIARDARSRSEQRPLFAPTLAGVGKAFTAMGQRLEERYAPTDHYAPGLRRGLSLLNAPPGSR